MRWSEGEDWEEQSWVRWWWRRPRLASKWAPISSSLSSSLFELPKIIIITITIIIIITMIVRRMMGPGVGGVVICLACLGWPGGGQAQVITITIMMVMMIMIMMMIMMMSMMIMMRMMTTKMMLVMRNVLPRWQPGNRHHDDYVDDVRNDDDEGNNDDSNTELFNKYRRDEDDVGAGCLNTIMMMMYDIWYVIWNDMIFDDDIMKMMLALVVWTPDPLKAHLVSGHSVFRHQAVTLNPRYASRRTSLVTLNIAMKMMMMMVTIRPSLSIHVTRCVKPRLSLSYQT